MKLWVYLIIVLNILILNGCKDGGNQCALNEFRSFIRSNDRYQDLSFAKIEYPRSALTRAHSKDANLGPDWEYVLMGKVKKEVDLRILCEAVLRMNLQDKISVEVQIEKNHRESATSGSRLLIGYENGGNQCALNEFRSFIRSNDRYQDLSFAKIEYPRSARTREHSKDADLGPDWEYVLMGKVKKQVDLTNLIEAIYRMNLQDKISVEVQIEAGGKREGPTK